MEKIGQGNLNKNTFQRNFFAYRLQDLEKKVEN